MPQMRLIATKSSHPRRDISQSYTMQSPARRCGRSFARCLPTHPSEWPRHSSVIRSVHNASDRFWPHLALGIKVPFGPHVIACLTMCWMLTRTPAGKRLSPMLATAVPVTTSTALTATYPLRRSSDGTGGGIPKEDARTDGGGITPHHRWRHAHCTVATSGLPTTWKPTS